MRKTLSFLLLLTACSNSEPTPANCRGWGVAVGDHDTVTGRIIKEHIDTPAVVRAKCQSPFVETSGCTLAVGPGEYVIWTVDDPAVVLHERCHALFEQPLHTE